VDDNGTSESPPEGSIYRKDGPRDLAKPQDNGDDTIDQSHSSPGYMGLGPKDPGDYSKTKYPYRDEKPSQKNADHHFVAQLHLLEQKLPLYLPYQTRTSDRVAATAEQILAGLNPKVQAKADKVQVRVQRVDTPNLRWIFSVDGSKGNKYAVKVRAVRPRKNTTKFSKMDLEVSCSCPAWQWQGPEYHATQKAYQNDKVPLQGTASVPHVRDPSGQNKVCKHVAAVLNMTRAWEVPVTRQMKKKR
jgi:hypothetical protein